MWSIVPYQRIVCYKLYRSNPNEVSYQSLIHVTTALDVAITRYEFTLHNINRCTSFDLKVNIDWHSCQTHCMALITQDIKIPQNNFEHF